VRTKFKLEERSDRLRIDRLRIDRLRTLDFKHLRAEKRERMEAK